MFFLLRLHFAPVESAVIGQRVCDLAERTAASGWKGSPACVDKSDAEIKAHVNGE